MTCNKRREINNIPVYVQLVWIWNMNYTSDLRRKQIDYLINLMNLMISSMLRYENEFYYKLQINIDFNWY